jgi:hypothetical protein
VQRGLDDELKETAYTIIAGVDGRTHHLRFGNLDMTGDSGDAPSPSGLAPVDLERHCSPP